METTAINDKVSYCINHGIKIYPKVNKFGDYVIVVAKYHPNRGWSELPGEQSYARNPTGKQEKWYDKVYELYHYYYDQLRKLEDAKSEEE